MIFDILVSVTNNEIKHKIVFLCLILIGSFLHGSRFRSFHGLGLEDQQEVDNLVLTVMKGS